MHHQKGRQQRKQRLEAGLDRTGHIVTPEQRVKDRLARLTLAMLAANVATWSAKANIFFN